MRRRRPRVYVPGQPGAINTRAWRKLAAQVVAEEPVCWMRLPGICTVASQTADHLIPRKYRPDLYRERSNLRGACRACNMRRGAMSVLEVLALRQRLAREATTQQARALKEFFG